MSDIEVNDNVFKCEVTYSVNSEEKAVSLILEICRTLVNKKLIKSNLEMTTKFNDKGEKIRFDVSILCIGSDTDISEILGLITDLFK